MGALKTCLITLVAVTLVTGLLYAGYLMALDLRAAARGEPRRRP